MKTCAKTIILIRLLSFPVISLHAQTTEKPESFEWSIDGAVSDDQAKTPIEHATVFLFREDTKTIEFTTRSDSEGKFRLTGTLTGQFRLFAEAPERLRTEFGAADSNQPGTSLALWPTRHLKNVEISLFRGGTISGKILDHETRKPVEGCRLAALRPTLFRGMERNVSVAETSSLQDGTFTIQNISTGDYKIQLNCSDSETGEQSLFFYPNSTGAAGASIVSVIHGKDSFIGVIETDRIKTNTVLQGRLHLGNSKYKDIKVDLYSLTDLIPTASASLHCQINATQQFSCRAKPGVYKLYATWQNEDGSARLRSVETVTISSKPSSPIELTLNDAPEVTLRFKVKSPDTHLPSAKSSEAETSPSPRVTFASRDGYWDAGPVTCTSPELCHVAVPPGSYRVQVQGLPPGYFVASVSYVGIIESNPLVLTIAPDGIVGEVVILLRQDGGAITGRLVDRSGEAVANRQVAIIPKDDTLKYVFYQFVTAGSSGQFSFQSVPSGLYELRSTSGFEPEAIFDREASVLATISLKPNELSSGVYTVSK